MGNINNEEMPEYVGKESLSEAMDLIMKYILSNSPKITEEVHTDDEYKLKITNPDGTSFITPNLYGVTMEKVEGEQEATAAFTVKITNKNTSTGNYDNYWSNLSYQNVQLSTMNDDGSRDDFSNGRYEIHQDETNSSEYFILLENIPAGNYLVNFDTSYDDGSGTYTNNLGLQVNESAADSSNTIVVGINGNY